MEIMLGGVIIYVEQVVCWDLLQLKEHIYEANEACCVLVYLCTV